MDLNARIINAVKECPLLYKTNASIAQRQRGWKQLAEKTQLHEQFLKSRWHFLRQQFTRVQQENGCYFKYMRDMEFLLPYMHTPAHTAKYALRKQASEGVIQPEFVITEKDIEHESDSEEYIFLEVEALETSAGDEVTCVKTEVQLNAEEIRAQLEEPEPDNPTQNRKSVSDSVKSDKDEKGAAEEHSKQPIEETTQQQNEAKMKIGKPEQQPVVLQQPEEVKHQPEKEQVQQQASTAKKDSQNTATEVPESSARCEDDIFGELVAVMLKRMPAEKRRTVKKDIMNLLLT